MERKIMNEAYIGHDSQLSGVEEHRLVGGRGDGMRLLQVRNGLGLEFTVSADRCADIARLSFKGDNYAFISPCGYVSPAYYDDKGLGWLKSFTAGFLTTCGLTAVGSPTKDAGEELPLHGRIANTPAENIRWETEDEAITIRADMSEAWLFAHKLKLRREIVCSKVKNELTVTDRVKNFGDRESPLMLLYHMNMGYPLLSETAELFIPSENVTARTENARRAIGSWAEVLPPQAGYEEQCFYHEFLETGRAGIYNPAIGKGVLISFDTAELDCLTQWKMMGVRDYVMGLEPGNCYPDGRDVMRAEDRLKFIAPGEEKKFTVRITIVENRGQWDRVKGKP